MANLCPCSFGNSLSGALLNLRNAKKLSNDSPEQTASATVLSRRVERTNEITMYQESPWLYRVRFRLETGEELEFQAKEADYSRLKEGIAVTVTWQEKTLVSFIIPLA